MGEENMDQYDQPIPKRFEQEMIDRGPLPIVERQDPEAEWDPEVRPHVQSSVP